MWRTDCRRGAVPWTPRPALAPVWSRPTFLTASGGSPSCTAPTRTLTFHPKVHPGTPPLPVICKFRCTSITIYLILLLLIRCKVAFGGISFFFSYIFLGRLGTLLASRYYFSFCSRQQQIALCFHVVLSQTQVKVSLLWFDFRLWGVKLSLKQAPPVVQGF